MLDALDGKTKNHETKTILGADIMKFWKCEFCKHDKSPRNPNACLWEFQRAAFDACGCADFELSDRLPPRVIAEFHKHENLDGFVDRLDAELSKYQRSLLHRLAFNRPLYVRFARGSSRSDMGMLSVVFALWEASNGDADKANNIINSFTDKKSQN